MTATSPFALGSDCANKVPNRGNIKLHNRVFISGIIEGVCLIRFGSVVMMILNPDS